MFYVAANRQDYAVLLGFTIFIEEATIVGHLLTDITYGLLDLRIPVRTSQESFDVTEVMRRVVHRVSNDPVRVPLVSIDDHQRAPGRRRQTGEPVVQCRRLANDAGQRFVDVDEARLGVEPGIRGRAEIAPRLLRRRVEKEPHGEEDLANMIGVLGDGPHIGDGSSEQFV